MAIAPVAPRTPKMAREGSDLFQDFDRLDIVGIDIIDIVPENTIHHIQGMHLADTNRSADADIRFLAGRSVVDDIQTGNLALERQPG